ncbi:diguanylate cyclase (GGDEF) domain-containing protein [Alkalithermobacter thermoalcaliphilus JW-YL-7 = DSM 7308]|uniref:Diguanylate cyclase n=1 Tax=Alkalithermobacter thermoalcaliphilus JW-YL-7 = DSM 7308 TaxID=1121328 RepID=A0A150FNR1_CLOPD|nr:diguanylate cyclase [[Clostridium] paradoxum JW-YL-7 = DSM 7308]SHK87096.1 diguanylate cyclase (GGDEF) domain-containing protein [[Clostridium] paradoxum JW-YL-7 = DSM 7308]
MEKVFSLGSLIEKIDFLINVYDAIRIVNPVKKKVYYFFSKNDECIKEESFCYEFWNQNKMCSNCISMRAYTQEETFVKIEYNGEKIYIITATPVISDSEKIVVEFLKDATNTSIIEDMDGLSNEEIYLKINNLNELLVKDALTNVFNRRFIEDRLPVDILKSNFEQYPLSIIMCDIDFFKKVNDTYGHIAGDAVLKQFAFILQKNIRKNDWVARYGGEEFLIVLNGLNKEKAIEIAQRIRKNVENEVIKYNEFEIKITSSFGVYEISGEKNYLDIIEKADKNLYKAKNLGRNKVVG